MVDFFWRDPDAGLVELVHAGGALASWQLGSVAEAVDAERTGCDFVIARGIEARGHLRGRLSLLPLLSGVLNAVSIPVLAAGGIGAGHSLAAVLSAGAAGAGIGKRFIAAQESNAHPDYVRALIAARAEDVVRTARFGGECPMCPSLHSVLGSALETAEALPNRPLAEVEVPGERYPIFPLQGRRCPPGRSRDASKRWRVTRGSRWAACAACSRPPRSSRSWPAARRRCSPRWLPGSSSSPGPPRRGR